MRIGLAIVTAWAIQGREDLKDGKHYKNRNTTKVGEIKEQTLKEDKPTGRSSLAVLGMLTRVGS